MGTKAKVAIKGTTTKGAATENSLSKSRVANGATTKNIVSKGTPSSPLARSRRSSLPVQDANEEWRQQNIGRLLNNAIKRFESRILRQMSSAGHGDFSLSHITITRNLDVEGTRATEIARRAGITKQSMGELITQLENDGLIERRPDPDDKRAKIVCFTSAGMKWLDAFRTALQDAERQMEDELGAANLRSLKRALEKYGRVGCPGEHE